MVATIEWRCAQSLVYLTFFDKSKSILAVYSEVRVAWIIAAKNGSRYFLRSLLFYKVQTPSPQKKGFKTTSWPILYCQQAILLQPLGSGAQTKRVASIGPYKRPGLLIISWACSVLYKTRLEIRQWGASSYVFYNIFRVQPLLQTSIKLTVNMEQLGHLLWCPECNQLYIWRTKPHINLKPFPFGKNNSRWFRGLNSSNFTAFVVKRFACSHKSYQDFMICRQPGFIKPVTLAMMYFTVFLGSNNLSKPVKFTVNIKKLGHLCRCPECIKLYLCRNNPHIKLTPSPFGKKKSRKSRGIDSSSFTTVVVKRFACLHKSY